MYKTKPEANKKFSLSDATLLQSHSSQVNISQKTLSDRTLWGKCYFQLKKWTIDFLDPCVVMCIIVQMVPYLVFLPGTLPGTLPNTFQPVLGTLPGDLPGLLSGTLPVILSGTLAVILPGTCRQSHGPHRVPGTGYHA